MFQNSNPARMSPFSAVRYTISLLPPPHPIRNNELGWDDFISATDPMSEFVCGGPTIGG